MITSTGVGVRPMVEGKFAMLLSNEAAYVVDGPPFADCRLVDAKLNRSWIEQSSRSVEIYVLVVDTSLSFGDPPSNCFKVTKCFLALPLLLLAVLYSSFILYDGLPSELLRL